MHGRFDATGADDAELEHLQGSFEATVCEPCGEPGTSCNGDVLETCTAEGYVEMQTCELGCNAAANPARCYVLKPSNLPEDICLIPGTIDRTVERSTVIDTDGACPGGVVDQGPGLPEICVLKFASYS